MDVAATISSLRYDYLVSDTEKFSNDRMHRMLGSGRPARHAAHHARARASALAGHGALFAVRFELGSSHAMDRTGGWTGADLHMLSGAGSLHVSGCDMIVELRVLAYFEACRDHLT